jgi:5'-3' exonuclease
MGIPSYFSYIVKNHSRIIQKLTKKSQTTAETGVNHLYLDCNSIIYDAVHTIDFSKLIETDVKTIIRFVFQKIEEYIALIQPDTNIFIAFDGVAPVAKLDQQRERRYKSFYQAEILKSIFENSSKDQSSGKKDAWNTAAITPGTTFMKELSDSTRNYFNDPKKYGVKKIIISPSDEYGEGEHKLFQYIRKYPEEHSGSKTVIYGLDADLIMLSINHLPVAKEIYLFRETPHFIQSINKDLEPNESYLLDIPELARIITEDMQNGQDSQINRIYDYIFLCFFLGNDFLPHFPAANIRTGGVDKMLNAYKATIGSSKEVLTDGKTIYWKNVRKIVQYLANLEEEYFKNEIKLRNKREKFYYPTDTPENIYKKFDAIPTYERELEKRIDPFKAGWKERYYKCLFVFPLHLCTFKTPLSGAVMNGEGVADCAFEMRNGVKNDSEKEIEKISMNYLEGLEWTMKYYTTDCPNWRWSYKYSYPPLFSDLIRYIPIFERELVPFVQPQPVIPLVQLCYVLPFHSLKLLPKELYNKLSSEYADWYQTDCEFVWAFCKYFWESHVQLPEIEISELETLVSMHLKTA